MHRIFLILVLIIFSGFTKAALEEELSQVKLETQGEIPSWLSGTLIRNGPIDITIDGKKNAHWFDGLAMLHAFSFHNNEVLYSNKFLRTNAFYTVFRDGSLNYGGFASDPCRSRFKKFFTMFVPSKQHYLPNANVNVAYLAKEYVAMTETPLPIHFDIKTLDTLGVLDYQDKLPHEKAWESVHLHRSKNEMINYLIDYGQTSHYVIYKIKEGSSERQPFAKIPVKEPAYMHSFAMTENYVILTEFPLVVKPLDFITKGKSFIQNFTWQPERGTVFNVIDRKKGKLIGKYRTRPFFAFHHVNAYEKDNSLIIDIVTYEDARVITAVGDHFREMSPNPDRKEKHIPSFLERFTLTSDASGGKISSQKIGEHNLVEFPRINEKYDGMPYQFAYLADSREVDQKDDLRPLYKIDMNSQKEWRWEEAGCYPGEPVFVAAPDAKEEDEGVVLAVILDKLHNTSFLLVLDAKNFKEIGRATVPHIIPPGLHGQYFNLKH